jgi:glutamate synthase domain-containing protein 2
MTYKRFHIDTKPAPASFDYPITFRMDEMDDYVKYGHAALPEGRMGGDPYWTPQIITQAWYQAETGRIPISGAGYGGQFSGAGFDAMWLDMSEIVRPTRDGIHGRESISTAVDLGARPMQLSFDQDQNLVGELPHTLGLTMPVIFDPLPFNIPGRAAALSMAAAAQTLGIFAVLPVEEWQEDLEPYNAHLAPLVTHIDQLDTDLDWVRTARLVEVMPASFDEALELWQAVQGALPNALVAVRLPIGEGCPDCVEAFIHAGVGMVHLLADEIGMLDDDTRFVADALRGIHDHLVAHNLRDRISLVVGGGIAAAEHVPKALICGADAVSVDYALLLGLGCALWADARHPCKVENGKFEPEWGAQRLINLMSAWRDQLLEAMGAMGIREVRRVRGEIGRAIFYKDEEKKFKALFPSNGNGNGNGNHAHRMPVPEINAGEAEGDFVWTTDLLLSTIEMARTGRPPTSGMEYRTGKSGGGFDRLRFAFELESDSEIDWDAVDINSADLEVPLNRSADDRPKLTLPHPWYGGGMSFGSVSVNTMLSRINAAQRWNTYTSTGEGGYPEELVPFADHIITQVATGLFGVREETLQRAPIIEIKYAQGAKPGLGGHLLGSKATEAVARMRQSVQGYSLFSPFPFHSVYSVEDHKKHVDWLKMTNRRALLSVKVSTPTDVDMVAVGSYYAGAHIIHLDGSYGGTGAAPEIAKKNIAMPLEYAIPKVHRFLEEEGIRDEVVVMASGGVRTAFDVAKAVALGADGCVIGTADLVALGCVRLGCCEKECGCPFGIATTDPEMTKLIDPVVGAERIYTLYAAWRLQLAGILQRLGLANIRDLRGRTDLLVYLEA